MSDELSIEGKTYITSKRAAETTGYTQDYVGQLARGGHIDAQRVGGLWYIGLDSLMAYKKKADEYKPQPPQPVSYQMQDPETLLSFDGKEYVSAVRASKLTGYHQDYVGQLARSEKIQSRQIGNRWYVEREGLEAHKTEKDALLAAVQKQAVGLPIQSAAVRPAPVEIPEEEPMRYSSDPRHLMPVVPLKATFLDENDDEEGADIAPIPVYAEPGRRDAPRTIARHPRHGRKSNKGLYTAATAVLTIVIVLSLGFTTLKNAGKYTADLPNNIMRGMSASAGSLGDVLERWLSPELVYVRPVSDSIDIAPETFGTATTSGTSEEVIIEE